jgi:hypothetical protein
MLETNGSYPPRGRVVFAGQFENMASWLGSGRGGIVPTALVGFEWETSDPTSVILQTRAGILGGYKFNQNIVDADGSELNACERRSRTPSECRGLVVQPTFSFTVLERLRFEINAELMPAVKGSTPWQILPEAGLQLYF